MESKIAIMANNVSKKYCKNLKRSMIYGVRDIWKNMFGRSSNSGILRRAEFWAVDNISFELKKGESLGIVGSNGSGKTTFLKMLNGIFWPDRGKIIINGKTGALIEVGAGFHPLLTGRENIYINGAILGMSKREIDKKFDEIVEFSDIGSFIDVPVKFYSSGMFVRLGFSIAAHCEPEILLIDEVLAVGDLAFILKCHRKMSEFRLNNGTVVIVSHNLRQIRNICKKALWIENGRARAIGEVNHVCDLYEEDVFNRDKKSSKIRKNILSYDDRIKISKVEFLDKNDKVCKKFWTKSYFKIRIHFNCERIVKKPMFNVSIFNPGGEEIIISYSNYDGYQFDEINGNGYIDYYIEELFIKPSQYYCSVILSEKEVSNILEWHEKYYSFIVVGNTNCGLVNLSPKWSLKLSRS